MITREYNEKTAMRTALGTLIAPVLIIACIVGGAAYGAVKVHDYFAGVIAHTQTTSTPR